MNAQAQALLNRTELLLSLLYSVSVTIERFGGGVNASADLNSAAFAGAQEFLNSVGGGFIDFGPGVYKLANVGSGSVNGSEGVSSWDNRYCLFVKYPNIYLRGRGYATTLKLEDGENAHVIKFGQRVGTSINFAGGGVLGLSIDGNRANQTLPDPSNNHWSGIDVSSGCSDIYIKNFYIHDCLWYGIGMERDGIHNASIRNGRISRVGVDAIDWKDDSDTAYGNSIDNVYADNWGLLDVAISGDPAAAFDLRSGIIASRVICQSPGQSAVAAVRLQNGTPGASPKQPTQVVGGRGEGANVAGSAGVRVISRGAIVENFTVTGWDDGVSCTEPDCRFGNITALANVTSAMRLWKNSTTGTTASTNRVAGLVARSNGNGVIVDDGVAEVSFSVCEVRGNTGKGYDLRTGCSNIRITEGSCTGNGTNLSDNGASTRIRDVSGIKTEAVVTVAVPITTTGTKTYPIAHGMPFTPNISDVTLSLNASVGDWSSAAPRVTAIDATNITVQLPVSTASTSPNATANVVATVRSKNR
ncbi:hypothetical protein [Burkholderia sp. Bp8986]|uniref:hypothetical protein n=1 Tax=Burkholderia sp. Bp8986 TaxID=2184550 RepID=UPI000F59C358|nr:hypothetical protein [Burkholderia sp. Bp8986]